MLIKPASGNCNLRCRYCFYHDVAENREIENYGMMDISTLEILVKKALESAEHYCTFAFQGGEPTLRGLDFYRNFVELVKKYNSKKIKVNNTIQTNGILIDDKWAKFLADNNFLVGLSLDGPKDINDSNRIDPHNKGTFKRIMQTAKIFDQYKVEYNMLIVTNSYVARHIRAVYEFFRDNNFRYLQFIPCLDPLKEQPGQNNYSLTPNKFTYFLKNLFDMWYDDIKKDNYISIRTFDNYVRMFMGYRPESCGMSGECVCQVVVEADGGVYPCDFYVIDDWYLGNIKEKSIEELINSDKSKEFIEVSRHIDEDCKNCNIANICRGGCRRTREPFIDGKPVLNYFCSSYKEFFEYAIPRIQELANNLKNGSR